VKLSVCVQHHPSRAALLPIPHLGRHELVVDPEPEGVRSCFRTYLECLRRTPASATHRLIVQDDAIPCPGFRERARALLEERPDELVAFFVPGRTLLRRLLADSHKRGESWVRLPPSLNWTPTVALAWPAGLIPDFIDYGERVVAARARRGMATMADDPYVGEWKKKRGHPVSATVPCLVEHPDLAQSLYREGLRPRGGGNRARVAALYED
jgi:hypothetical protein